MKLLQSAIKNNMNLIVGNGGLYSADDVNVKDSAGNTALYYACRHGNHNFAKFLLLKGALPNIICNNGNTALHMAFQSNSIEVPIIILN